MIEVAVKYQKPVRIGVNWGSLDQVLLTRMMDENSKLSEPKDARDVTMEAMVVSALNSAELAQKYGLRADQITRAPRSAACRISSMYIARWLRVATTRCIWDSPKPGWALKA